MVVLVICSIVFVAGLVGLAAGVRGRRVDDHPRCRRCGYDLSGTPALPAACPECGRAIADGGRRAVRIGNRRRRRGLIVAGGATALLALIIGGTWAVQESRGFDWNTIKPVWWLRAEINSAEADTADAARTELLARVERGELSEGKQASLIDPVLDLLADPDGHWHEEWGAFFERAWQRGIASKEQLTRYLDTAVASGLQIDGRERMRQGSRVAIAVSFRPRTAQDSLFSMAYDVEEMSFAGGDITEAATARRGEWRIHRFRPTRSGESYYYFEVDAPLGAHTLQIRTRVVVGEGEFSTGVTGEQPFEQPLLDRELTLSAMTEVVPPDVQVMNAVDSEELREAIRASMTIERPRLKADGEGKAGIFGTLSCWQAPVHFDSGVLWRVDGTEYTVGFLNVRANNVRTIASSSWRGHKIPLDGPPERVDIIVRSTIEDAEGAARLSNDTEVWVGELVFEDVDVEYLEAGETPYTTIATDEAHSAFMQRADLAAIEFRQVGDTVSIHSRGGLTGVPYSFAYSCSLRVGERVIPGSSSVMRPGDSREFYFGDQKVDEFPEGLETIDVIFRPNEGMAARSFSREDVVFNRELVFEDVPVIWVRE